MAKKNANNGFIKIDRSILDWEHITEPVVLQVFLYLLLKANHKAKWHNGKMCERGATFVSIRTMCEDLAMSPHTAIKALRTLEESGEVVRRQVTQKLSKTKLLNYSKYQGNNVFSVAQTATQSATQTATQSATKQERKERKENIESRNKKTHTHEEILQGWLDNKITLEAFCKNERITPTQFEQLGKAVINEWAMTGETGANESDTRKKMLAHIRAKAQAMRDRGLFLGAEPENERLQGLVSDCETMIADGYKRKDVIRCYKYYTQRSNDGSGRMIFETLNGWNTRTRFNEFINRERK